MSEHKIKQQRKMLQDAVRKERETIENQIKQYINRSPFIQRIRFAGLVLRGKV